MKSNQNELGAGNAGILAFRFDLVLFQMETHFPLWGSREPFEGFSSSVSVQACLFLKDPSGLQCESSYFHSNMKDIIMVNGLEQEMAPMWESSTDLKPQTQKPILIL